MIDVFWSKLYLLYIHNPVSIGNTTLHSKILFIALSRSATRILLRESNYQHQRTIKRVTYNEQNGYHFWHQIWEWHRFSTFSPTISIWNHHLETPLAAAQAAWQPRRHLGGIDNKSTIWQFSLGFHLIIYYARVFSLFLDKAHFPFLSTLQQSTKHCNMTSPEIMTSPNDTICHKQLL